MKLRDDDLFQLNQLAMTAACQAGEIISKYSHKPISVKTKTGGASLASQVVTKVDYLCQEKILEILTASFNTFGLALLTEETPDDLGRLQKDFFWCIDPLDGTLPFIESSPGYAVSLALVSRTGIPHIGVVFDPVEHVLYHAIKGKGAFRNGKPWKLSVSSALTGQPLTLITDRSFKQHHLYTETVADLKNISTKMGYEGFNIISLGGAAMNACWVLEKAPACYFKFPKPQNGGGSLWDYAATACLFLEAGAIVSDIFGAPLDLNRPDSTFMNHRGILYSCDHDMAEQIMGLYTKVCMV